MSMRSNWRGVRSAALGWGLLVGLAAGCTEDEVGWETARSSVGAQISGAEADAERFRDYRVDVTRALGVMEESLATARRRVSVADHAEVDAMSERIVSLRTEFVATASSGASQGDDALRRYGELEAAYEALRGDVEAFLLRAGTHPDEFARWRAVPR